MTRWDLLLGVLLLADGGPTATRSELLVRDLPSDPACQTLRRSLGLAPDASGGMPGTRIFGWVHRSGGSEPPPGTAVALSSEMGSGVETAPDARGTFFVTVDGKTAKLTVSAPGSEPASRALAAGTYCVEATLVRAGTR